MPGPLSVARQINGIWAEESRLPLVGERIVTVGGVMSRIVATIVSPARLPAASSTVRPTMYSPGSSQTFSTTGVSVVIWLPSPKSHV